MSCRNSRRYYVVSEDNKLCYGFLKSGGVGIVDNLPWSKPRLFSRVKLARQIADKYGYSVRFYPGIKRVIHTAEK